MNIDKDIERCKELIKIEHSNWIGMSNQDAIENVLSELETYKKANDNLLVKNAELKIELKTLEQSNKNLLAKKSELETYKKIAEKLAERVKTESVLDSNCYEEDGHTFCKKENKNCKQCIIDWARKEVEK